MTTLYHIDIVMLNGISLNQSDSIFRLVGLLASLQKQKTIRFYANGF
jgi:hypothetical protein